MASNGTNGTGGYVPVYSSPNHSGGYQPGPAPNSCGTCSQPPSRH